MLRPHSTYLFPSFSFLQWKEALCQWGTQVLMDGWSQASILTQVCVIGFAELLLSAEAELELRFVWPAQGVSILKGSEGITSVAVGDKAKIVPGSGTENEAWSTPKSTMTRYINGKIWSIQLRHCTIFSGFFFFLCPRSIVLFLFKPIYFCLI